MLKICFAGGSGHSDRVVRDLAKIPDIQAAAFCRTYPGERTRAIEPLQLKEYASFEEMMDAEEPDILVSDGIFCSHSRYALEALERGVHVFCEKPVATDMDAFNRLQEAVSAPGAPLFWGMLTSRYQHCFYTAKVLVEQGAIGRIRMMNSQKSYPFGRRPEFYKKREEFGGIIPWVSIHAIDWMLWIADRKCLTVSGCQSRTDNRGYCDMEVTAVSVMQLEDDVMADVHADFLRPTGAKTHGDDRLRIVGTEGILEVRDEQVYLLDADHDGTEPVTLLPPPRTLFEDFVHTIRGGSGGLITPEGSLYSTYVALKCREAADRPFTEGMLRI